MIQIVVIDPYDDKATSLLVPFLTRRVLEFAKAYQTEMDPKQMAKTYLTRLFMGDPGIACVVFLDEKGRVVGHAVATIETDGVNKWVFVSQCKADEDVGDTVERAIHQAEEWGRSHGATRIVMATHRLDEAWRKKYGFKAFRHVMGRAITTEELN